MLSEITEQTKSQENKEKQEYQYIKPISPLVPKLFSSVIPESFLPPPISLSNLPSATLVSPKLSPVSSLLPPSPFLSLPMPKPRMEKYLDIEFKIDSIVTLIINVSHGTSYDKAFRIHNVE